MLSVKRCSIRPVRHESVRQSRTQSLRSQAVGAILAFGLLALFQFNSAQAQDVPRPPEADDEKPVLREQTIYIPYAKFRETFEKQGRGVFLPYEQFQQLWDAARQAQQEKPVVEPPVKAVIQSADSEANVRGEVVEVTARLTIELLAPGWHEIPLRLADAAILSATIDGKPARLIADPQRGHLLMVQKKDRDPQEIELQLKYAKSYTKQPGQNRVSFQSPLAPLNRWTIRVPEPDVRVHVEPLLAATEKTSDASAENAADPDQEKADPDQETVLLAFLGAAPTVTIDWTAKAEGAAGLEALATAMTEQEIRIEEGVVRTSVRIDYSISRASLTTLKFLVPPDQKIVNVVDANIKQWAIDDADGAQQVVIELFQAADRQQSVYIELERFAAMDNQREIQAPVIEAQGVARQQGVVVVQVADDLRSETVRRTGLLQMDASELPPRLAKRPWDLAYRFAGVPYDLAIEVEKVQPEIEAQTLTEVYLQPDQLQIEMVVLYNIRRAGVFELRLDVPADYEVRRVTGREITGSAAAVVDTFQRTGENKNQLLVNLGTKAEGKVALVVELEKQLSDPNLVSPTGAAAKVPLPLPGVAADGVRARRGNVVIYAPDSLRVNPGELDLLRPVSFEEAVAEIPSIRDGRIATLRGVLAFAYSDEPGTLALSAERRKPQVNVRQLVVAQVDEGVVKFTATFYYDILYSGVKSLRIDLPAAVAAEARNTSGGVRDTVIEPAPDDLEKGYVAWKFTGQSELLGSHTLTLNWQQPMAKLDVGKSVELPVPHLRPQQADRAWGQIVVTKSENIDVQPGGEPAGLRPIDPQRDLMPDANVTDAAQAFEFHDDWKLSILATRYQPETLKHTSIERAVVRMVVTRGDRIAVQALYSVLNSLQRLPLKLPPEATFDIQPLRIAGQPQTLERGDKGQYFIPLVGQSADEPFLLELRYTVPGDGSQLELPQFTSSPAVQKVSICVYLPQEWKLLASTGPWTDLQKPAGPFAGRGYSSQSDEELVRWVQGDLNSANDPLESFPVDGDLYIFSALGPAPDEPNTLRLTTAHENTFNAMVFGLIALGGVVLFTRPAGDRLLGVAALIVALVLLGAFAPTLAGQILGSTFWTAIFLVLGAWIAYFLARDLPKMLQASAARRAERQYVAPAVVVAQPQDFNDSEESGPPSEIPPVERHPDGGPFEREQGEEGNTEEGGERHE